MKDPRKRRRLGGAVIGVTAVALLVGYLLRGCGGSPMDSGKGGAESPSQKTEAPVEAPKTVSVTLVRIVLKDNLIHLGTRRIGWTEFDVLTREAHERGQKMELVVHGNTMHTKNIRRVERVLAQSGVRYFFTNK